MSAVIFASFILALLPGLSSEAEFLKCCPSNQQLHPSFQRCVDRETPAGSDPTGPDAQYPWWLPKNATALSSVTRQPLPGFFSNGSFLEQVRHGGWEFCGSSSAMVLADPNDFAYLDDGSLLFAEGSRTLPPGSFCADSMSLTGEEIAVVTSCPCGILLCLRRCCPMGYSLAFASGSSRCFQSDDYDEEETWRVGFTDGGTPGDFVRVHGTNFCAPGVRMYALEEEEVAVVQRDGSLSVSTGAVVPRGQFCADSGAVLACAPAAGVAREVAIRTYGAMSAVGAALLAATLVVQALLPHRGGHERHLAAHNSSLLVTYVALSVGQLTPSLPSAACYVIAFIIQFTFLAAIFWLNVMCIDIAWSFSGFHVPTGNFMKSRRKRFMVYSFYAWGSCAVISITTIIIEFSPSMPESVIRPEFARKTCWFGSDAATLAYFYGPVACLLLGNLVLFVYTVVRILQMRKSTAVLRQAESAYHRGKIKEEEKVKKRFMLYLKLFCLMGVTWTTEVISWAVNTPSYYWYVTDIINVFRALFIFIIFCCKREVMNHLQTRLNQIIPWCMPKPNQTQDKDCSSSGQTDLSRYTWKSSAKSSAKSSKKKSSISNNAETIM